MKRMELLLKGSVVALLLFGSWISGHESLQADEVPAQNALERLFSGNGKPRVTRAVGQQESDAEAASQIRPTRADNNVFQRFWGSMRGSGSRPRQNTTASPIPPVPPDYAAPEPRTSERVAAPSRRPESAPRAVPAPVTTPTPVPPANTRLKLTPAQVGSDRPHSVESSESLSGTESSARAFVQPGPAPGFMDKARGSDISEDSARGDFLDVDVINERVQELGSEAFSRGDGNNGKTAAAEPEITLPSAGPATVDRGANVGGSSSATGQLDLLAGREPAITYPPASYKAQSSSSSEQFREEQAKIEEEQNSREMKLERIRSRDGLAGFKGFCPVVLRDRKDLVEADPRITSRFDGEEYSFSSRRAQRQFEEDPLRYAPANRGLDAVLLARGREVRGQLDYALWFRNRLYLFSSRESMAEFNSRPQQFAESGTAQIN